MATTVVNQAYGTSGNGGRKIVRLSNGWLISVVTDNVGLWHYFYKSTDKGTTWTQLTKTGTTGGTGSTNFVSIVSKEMMVYYVINDNKATVALVGSFDATTVSASNATTTVLDNGQTAFGPGITLAINEDGTELHAAWASKNSTYPNSFNIRYAKGTIDGSGNVMWGSVEQVTKINDTTRGVTNPSVVEKNDGTPLVIADAKISGSSSTYIVALYKNGSSWVNTSPDRSATVYDGGAYTQSNPCAVVDGNGVIHVVWHGQDSTDTAALNIRYSKSSDGGSTWSAMTKITTGNSYSQRFASISVDKNNKLYVFFQGLDSAVSLSIENIRRALFDGSAWSVTTLTNSTTTHTSNASAMEKEASSLIGWIYRDSAVKFDSITLNKAPKLSLTSPADNLSLAAGGNLEVKGTASDADGDSLTVIASLNGASLGTVGLGTGSTTWQVLIPEPNLQMGDNTLVVTAIDGKGATASKTLKLAKSDGDVPLLVNDIRYKLPATDDVVAWAKREEGLTVDAALSGVAPGENEWYATMEKTAAAADEDQFYTALPVKKDNVTLRLTMTRQSTDQDVGITRLIGGIGK